MQVTFASDDLSDVGSSCSQVLEDDVVKGIGALAYSFNMELKTMTRRFLDDPVLINMIGGEVNRGLLQRLIDEDDGEEDIDEAAVNQAEGKQKKKGPRPTRKRKCRRTEHGVQEQNQEKGPKTTRKRKRRMTKHGVQEQNQKKDEALNQEEAAPAGDLAMLEHVAREVETMASSGHVMTKKQIKLKKYVTMVIKHVRGTSGAALAQNTEEVHERAENDDEEEVINSTSQRNSYMRFCRRLSTKKAKEQYPQLVAEFADPKKRTSLFVDWFKGREDLANVALIFKKRHTNSKESKLKYRKLLEKS